MQSGHLYFVLVLADLKSPMRYVLLYMLPFHSVPPMYNSMSTHVRDPYQGLSFSLSEYEYRGIRVFYVTYYFCATEIKRYSYCRSVFVPTTCHTSVVRSPKAPLRNAVSP